MLVLFAIRWPGSFTFARSINGGEIYPDDADANWNSTSFAKLIDLPQQIADHPVYLFDHCFGQNLGFSPDLNIRDVTAEHWCGSYCLSVQ